MEHETYTTTINVPISSSGICLVSLSLAEIVCREEKDGRKETVE